MGCPRPPRLPRLPPWLPRMTRGIPSRDPFGPPLGPPPGHAGMAQYCTSITRTGASSRLWGSRFEAKTPTPMATPSICPRVSSPCASTRSGTFLPQFHHGPGAHRPARLADSHRGERPSTTMLAPPPRRLRASASTGNLASPFWRSSEAHIDCNPLLGASHAQLALARAHAPGFWAGAVGGFGSRWL
jgi:hypothetical protein